jgi:hypothetical protein
MIRFLRHQFKYGCRIGLGKREAAKRAVHFYLRGFN